MGEGSVQNNASPLNVDAAWTIACELDVPSLPTSDEWLNILIPQPVPLVMFIVRLSEGESMRVTPGALALLPTSISVVPVCVPVSPVASAIPLPPAAMAAVMQAFTLAEKSAPANWSHIWRLL